MQMQCLARSGNWPMEEHSARAEIRTVDPFTHKILLRLLYMTRFAHLLYALVDFAWTCILAYIHFVSVSLKNLFTL